MIPNILTHFQESPKRGLLIDRLWQWKCIVFNDLQKFRYPLLMNGVDSRICSSTWYIHKPPHRVRERPSRGLAQDVLPRVRLRERVYVCLWTTGSLEVVRDHMEGPAGQRKQCPNGKCFFFREMFTSWPRETSSWWADPRAPGSPRWPRPPGCLRSAAEQSRSCGALFPPRLLSKSNLINSLVIII